MFTENSPNLGGELRYNKGMKKKAAPHLSHTVHRSNIESMLQSTRWQINRASRDTVVSGAVIAAWVCARMGWKPSIKNEEHTPYTIFGINYIDAGIVATVLVIGLLTYGAWKNLQSYDFGIPAAQASQPAYYHLQKPAQNISHPTPAPSPRITTAKDVDSIFGQAILSMMRGGFNSAMQTMPPCPIQQQASGQ